MTGPFGMYLLSLLAAVGHAGPSSHNVYGLPDTPMSDVVLLRYPYAVWKDPSLGPLAPMEVVRRDQSWFRKCFNFTRCPVIDGDERFPILQDANRVTVAGDCAVLQDSRGVYYVYLLRRLGDETQHCTTLTDVNAHLANAGAPPVSDADFRTFEELAEERKWRGTTRAGGGLAAALVAWGVVAGLVWVWWRR